MQEEVIPEVVELAKTALTEVAAEGPGSRVHVRVALQVAGGRKRLAAHATLVRLLLRVRHAMVVEVGGGGEPLPTHGTLVRLLP